ncbi:MAG: tRNA 2-thiouridine(34) synthase MnmA [Chloroflexi bacterium]|nr:tRNA 2-thiouridine(34) synthase MnmA [Chloroflexota bacterium]
MSKGKVIVAMSGGVDSSVALYLLREEGYEVVGVTMRLWSQEVEGASRHNRQCCSIQDIEDARRVCQRLGVPHYVLNFEREFKAHVIDYFVKEYARGRTPHPCIACNDKVKFAFFLRRAASLDVDFIATGHYARRRETPQGVTVLKAADATKDQTYVLYSVGQEELRRVLFPIGEIPKTEVRRIAREMELPVAEKPDSQEICFVPDGDYRQFLSDRTEMKPGPIVDLDGRVMGQHDGIVGYTVGQRKGLGTGFQGRKRYVVSIEAESNTVIVGEERDLLHASLRAGGVSFLSGHWPKSPLQLTAKIRYKSPEAPATLIPSEEGQVEVRFHEPQRAATPGQAVVFYAGEELLGGGVIEQVHQEVPVAAGRAGELAQGLASAAR